MESKEYKVDEISFVKLMETPLKHKLLITFWTILVAIAAGIYIYFQPNIYKATSTLEISAKKANPSINDLLATALSQTSQNIDTEIEILKSHFVAKKALEKVDFINRYYVVKNYKKIELYKEAPFKVEIKKGYGLTFNIYPKDNNSFTLEVKDIKDKYGNKRTYYREVKYNQWIKDIDFEIKVIKKDKMEKKNIYLIHSRLNKFYMN